MAVSKYFHAKRTHKNRILGKIRDLFYWLEHSQWDFDTYLNRRSLDVYQNPSWAKLPQYMQSYCQGYMDALYARFDRENLVWCIEHDGQNITSDEWQALYPEGKAPWKDREYMPSGFCYKDTRKPYSGMYTAAEERKRENALLGRA